eukprot:1875090-Ditylum_brightwellii.AAC.1
MEQASTSSSENDSYKSVLPSTASIPKNKQEKKKGDEDKDEAEASPSSSVDDSHKSASSPSTSTLENKQEKKKGDEVEVEASPLYS